MPILPRNASKSRNGLWPLTATSPEVGSIRPATRLNMVDLPQPVLPSTATISPGATSNESLSTASRSPRPLARRNTLLTSRNRMTGSAMCSHSTHALNLNRALRHRAVAQRPALDRVDGLLHHQHEQHELERPGYGAGHVEQLLLAQELVADPAGGADQLRHHHHARGITEIDLPCREDTRHDRRHDQHPEQGPAPRPKRHRHLEQVLRHGAEGVENLEGESRQRRHHHDEEDAKLDAVKPDNGDDHPRQRRNSLQEHQYRRDVALDAG